MLSIKQTKSNACKILITILNVDKIVVDNSYQDFLRIEVNIKKEKHREFKNDSSKQHIHIATAYYTMKFQTSNLIENLNKEKKEKKSPGNMS